MFLGALGHVKPPDTKHIEKWPLGAVELAGPVPVSLGCRWYTAFDTPVQIDGSWHLPDVSRGANLGTVRGGHDTCLAPMGAIKALSPDWWHFYNQAREGACVGFAHSKALTLQHRLTFDGFWLYDMARKLEGTFPSGEGTTGRSALEVLRTVGHRQQYAHEAVRNEALDGHVDPAYGISAYRWATTAEQVCNALGRPNAFAVPLLNSWGEQYPQVVWLPVATLERLLHEEGEADVITDR
jgi:hypothetical protein